MNSLTTVSNMTISNLLKLSSTDVSASSAKRLTSTMQTKIASRYCSSTNSRQHLKLPSLVHQQQSTTNNNHCLSFTKISMKHHHTPSTHMKKSFSSSSSSSSSTSKAINNNNKLKNSNNTPKQNQNLDPEQTASEMVNNSPSGDIHSRISGIDALASITPEQKRANFALAACLLGFSTWVWYYSMNAVGQSSSSSSSSSSNDNEQDVFALSERSLREEAEDARVRLEKKKREESDAKEMMDLDNVLKGNDGGVELENEMNRVVVSIAADGDIAELEEQALKQNGKGGTRPMWKKVVFFWKKE